MANDEERADPDVELNADELLALNREERQQLAVLSPGRLSAVLETRKPDSRAGEGLVDATKRAAGVAAVTSRKKGSKGLDLAGAVMGATTIAEYAKYRYKLAKLQVPGLPISLEVAREVPIAGKLQENALYVCHPLEDTYLLPADFHRYVFLSKLDEAGRVFGALGASSARVVSAEQGGKSLGAKVKAMDLFGGSANAEEEKTLSAETRFKWQGAAQPRLDPGDHPEEFPWYALEPTWRNLYEQRVENRLTEAIFNLEYSESFGVDGDLSGTAEGAELAVGANFKKFKTVTFTYEVAFPEGD